MAIIAPIVSTFDRSGIRKAERGFSDLKGSATRSLGGIKRAATLAAGAVATIGAVSAIKGAIGAASDLAETVGATEQIFGDAADAVLRFADGAAAIGQSKTDALRGAQTFGTFGKAAGLAGDDLSGFTTDLLTLSSDLASFYNESPEAVIEALGAGLRGEAEPLRRFGILMNDAALKAEALALGIYDGEGSLDAQQKVLAANALIFKSTADAQGDFLRTSDGLANSTRILKARLENVKATIGARLLPIVLRLATFFADRILPVIERVADAFSTGGIGAAVGEAAGAIRAALPAIGAALSSAGSALVDWIRPRIGPMLDQLAAWGEALGRWLLDVGLPWLGEKLAELGRALVDWIGPRIRPMLDQLGEWIAAAANWLLDVGLPLLVDRIVKLGDAMVDWLAPRLPDMIRNLGNFLADIGVWILTKAVPKLLELGARLLWALTRWVVRIWPEIAKGIGYWISDLGTWWRETAIPKAKEWGGDIVDAIVDGIKRAPGKILEALRDVIPSLSDIGGRVGGAIAGAVGGIVPFASGGIVRSPVLGLVGEAGPEAIVPLDQLDRLGGNVTINVSGALDPSAVARQIRQLLARDAARLGLAS